jgi:hypothetical protein
MLGNNMTRRVINVVQHAQDGLVQQQVYVIEISPFYITVNE